MSTPTDKDKTPKETSTPKDPTEVPIKVKAPVIHDEKKESSSSSSPKRDSKGHFVKKDKTSSASKKKSTQKDNGKDKDTPSVKVLKITTESISSPRHLSAASMFLESVELDNPDFISIGSKQYVSLPYHRSELSTVRLNRVINYLRHIDTVSALDKSISRWRKFAWTLIFLFGCSIGIIVSLISSKDKVQNELNSLKDSIPLLTTQPLVK